MKYEITTPSSATVVVDTNDKQYLEDIEKRGYKVQRVENVCIACEG